MFDAFKIYFALTMTGTFHVKKSVTHGFACLYLCLWLASAATTSTEECDPWKCKGPVRYYKDVNCTPIFDEAVDKCCPVRYDCSHLKLRSPNKCYANGREYEDEEQVPDEEQDPCETDCFCYGSIETIHCKSKVCESIGRPVRKGCYMERNITSCCSGNVICPEPGEAIPDCIIDGKTYKAGKYFTPSKNLDMSCQCTKDYKGQNIAPFCKAVKCDKAIRRNCVPIFFNNNITDCPYNDRCQNDKDVVIRANTEALKPSSELRRTSDQMQCEFGNITMEIGDELKEGTDHNSVCVKCICEVPPTPTCYDLPYDKCKMEMYCERGNYR